MSTRVLITCLWLWLIARLFRGPRWRDSPWHDDPARHLPLEAMLEDPRADWRGRPGERVEES